MPSAFFTTITRLLVGCGFALSVFAAVAEAQTAPGVSPAEPQQAAAPTDPFGRDTPRGTVRGFLSAARKGDDNVAREYLDTRLNAEAAATLAHQLFVVLDLRLPARLAEVSDAAEGSRANPLTPNQEVVGTISGSEGPVDIVVERVQRGRGAPIWLFSSRTLASIPALYGEITEGQDRTRLSRFLFGTRLGGVRLAEWFSVVVGIALFYLATVVLNRILTPLINLVWSRVFRKRTSLGRNALPVPARLLIMAVAGRWVLSQLSLSLLVRQFWSNAASVITIVAVVWLLILLNGEVEAYIRRRVARVNVAAATSLLRVLRRAADALAIFAGLLAMLRLFSVDPTAALAGLGVGGIAVALAAQKTLENVIAGASLILDQAVRVGDFLKMGDVIGTVDHIGLRSTRIRTLDRTIVTVPNSQIANASLETISERDKYWFHHGVGLRYETTPEQLHRVLEAVGRLLETHPSIDPESTRVRFIRFGPFSLDVEVFAYLHARDWNHFLEQQEQLLFSISAIIQGIGTAIAFPSQTTYLAGAQGSPAEGPLAAH